MGYKAKLIAIVGTFVLLGGGLVLSSAQAKPSSTHMTFTLPVHSEIWASDESWCDNRGPHITLRSVTDTGGASILLTFKNNTKGTHSVSVVGSAAFTLLNPTTGEAQIFKQPPLGGVGGNPFMYILTQDGVMHYIGRCVQDGKIGQLNHGRFSADLGTAGWADATVQALDCSNKGSSLNLTTNAGSAGGVRGWLIFTNSSYDVSVKKDPAHINDDSGIVASWGFSLSGSQIRKGGGEPHGPGGNPLVSSINGTGLGTALSPFVPATGAVEVEHGRCNKLY